MQHLENETAGAKDTGRFALFLFAFLLGISLRLWRLSEMSFTIGEVRLAKAAWQMALGGLAGAQGNMTYVGLSAVLFHIFEPSNFFARLVPAVAGGSLILLPWVWRRELGEKVALVLSFGLALDPTLLSFSRQIVTPLIAVAGVAWAVAAVRNRHPLLAGFLLAFGFLGGYSFWAVAVAGILFIWKTRPEWLRSWPKSFWGSMLSGFLIGTGCFSTGFLLQTEGLGGIGAGLVELAQLLVAQYELPFYQPVMIALAYSLLPLTFMLWKILHDLRNSVRPQSLPALLGWAVSVLLCLLLGRKDLGLLALASGFAWWGAAQSVVDVLQFRAERWDIHLGLTLFQLVIFGYILMMIKRMIGLSASVQDIRYGLVTLAAGVLLLGISAVLVGLGWGRDVSAKALRLSLLITLSVLTLGVSLRSIHALQQTNSLNFLAGPLLMTNNDVQLAIDELDREGFLEKSEARYDLEGVDPLFTWFFRYQSAWDDKLSLTQPDVILSAEDPAVAAADEYRGRNVVLYRYLDAQTVSPGDYLKTLFGKPLPISSANGILWIKSDLFSGAN